MGMSCAPGAAGSAGDVGEGMSVGTGISVGDGKAKALSTNSAESLSTSICGISVGDLAATSVTFVGARSVTCALAVAAVNRSAKIGNSAVGSSCVLVGTVTVGGCSVGKGTMVGTLASSPMGDVGDGNSVGTATLGESIAALLSSIPEGRAEGNADGGSADTGTACTLGMAVGKVRGGSDAV